MLRTVMLMMIAACGGPPAEGPHDGHLVGVRSAVKATEAPQGDCRAPASLPPDLAADPIGVQEIKQFPPGASVRLGRGFDAVTNDDRGDCVVANPSLVDTITGRPGGASTVFSMHYAQDSISLSQQLGLSASASFKMGVWRGDASASFYSDVVRTSQSAYVVIDVSVENQAQALKKYQLTPPARALLEAKDYSKFRRLCGDRFVASVTTGGLLRAVMVINSATEEEKRSILTKLRGGNIAFSGAAEFTDSFKKVSQSSTTDLYLLQKGAGDKPVPVKVDELITEAANFPASVSGANQGNAWPLYVTVKDYGVVEDAATFSLEDLTAERYALAGIAKRYSDSKLASADAMALYDRTTDASCRGYATRRRDALDDYAQRLETVANDCTNRSCCRAAVLPKMPDEESLPASCKPVNSCTVPLSYFAQPRSAGAAQDVECPKMAPGKVVKISLSGRVIARDRPPNWDTWICLRLAGKEYCNEERFGCPRTLSGCSGNSGDRPLSLFGLDSSAVVPHDGIVSNTLWLTRCTSRDDNNSQCSIDGGSVTFTVIDATQPK